MFPQVLCLLCFSFLVQLEFFNLYANPLLVAQQLYIPLRFFFVFFWPSMVYGMQDCGSCVGLCGAKRHREGRGAPKPNQN